MEDAKVSVFLINTYAIIFLMKTIYEKYGGYDFFHDSIYALYLDMFDHPEISYHFIGVDITRLSRLQTQYLIRAIGGPDMYEGKPVVDVHKHMEITPFQFQEIARSFQQVFLNKGVSIEDTKIIMKFVSGHEKQIVTARTNFMDRIMRPIYKFIHKVFGRFLSKHNSWSRSGKLKK